VWEGEREMNRREIEGVCESVRGRERGRWGVERGVNVGERELGGRGGREREREHEGGIGGERKIKKVGRESV
jgi:hypothetical protein